MRFFLILSNTYSSPLVMSLLLLFVLLTGFAYLSWIERRLLGRFTMRPGPNRAGPLAFCNPPADGIKMAFKEELLPTHVDKRVYILAPALAVSTAFFVWAVIPIASQGIELFGFTIPAAMADINVGILYMIAVTSIGSYGVVLAGWSSNNKYSLLGALRTSAQFISYELPLGIAIGTIVLIVGSMSMVDIVQFQADYGWLIFFPFIYGVLPFGWGIPLAFVGVTAFLIFFASGLAEAGRAPL